MAQAALLEGYATNVKNIARTSALLHLVPLNALLERDMDLTTPALLSVQLMKYPNEKEINYALILI